MLEYAFARAFAHAGRIRGMVTKPFQFLPQRGGVIRWNDKAGDAILYDFGHAGDISTDCRCAARHPFQEGLAEQLRNYGFVSIESSINTRQDNAERGPVRFDQVTVREIEMENDVFSFGHSLQFTKELRMIRLADDVQAHSPRKRLYQIIDAFMRKDSADETGRCRFSECLDWG